MAHYLPSQLSACKPIDTKPFVQLQFNHNSQQGLQDLLDGNADVALGKADITSDMVASQQISSMDIFKCLTSVRSTCLGFD